MGVGVADKGLVMLALRETGLGEPFSSPECDGTGGGGR